MKVLAIMGSPHKKGNSYKQVQLVEKRMKEFGEVEFEYLFLKDVELGDCVGCHICVSKGEDACPMKNGRAAVEEKLLAADGVIFASPIYSFHITALLKTFIDRFTYFVHRPQFFGKQAMVVVVRGALFKEAPKYLAKVAKSWGFNVASILTASETETLSPKYKEKALKEINEATEKFYKSLTAKTMPVPAFKDVMWFRMWRMTASAFKEHQARDYEFWTEKGWFNKDYYYDTRINIFKKVLASIAEKIMISFMSKVFKSE